MTSPMAPTIAGCVRFALGQGIACADGHLTSAANVIVISPGLVRSTVDAPQDIDLISKTEGRGCFK
ncbi:protein of unknown function [Hyphomicrobium sp. MC1]|nr:protein of unknown function [Hyphomicrobium sp. MC1]